MNKSIIEAVHSLEGIESKKNFLKEFSKSYQTLVKDKGITINELLVMAYAREGAKNLKTFNQWKSEGYAVKKGAKCLILWSAVIVGKNKEGHEDGQQDENAPKGKFFKIAFVFDENSVEKINN